MSNNWKANDDDEGIPAPTTSMGIEPSASAVVPAAQVVVQQQCSCDQSKSRPIGEFSCVTATSPKGTKTYYACTDNRECLLKINALIQTDNPPASI